MQVICTLIAKALIAVCVFLMSGSAAVACNIPVFRYALERWQPDNCELILFHRGPLTPDQQQKLNQLDEQRTAGGEETASTLTLSDLASPTPPACELVEFNPNNDQSKDHGTLPRRPHETWKRSSR